MRSPTSTPSGRRLARGARTGRAVPPRADADALARATESANAASPDRELERAIVDRPPRTETVRRWWADLADADRERLVHRLPLLVGNLDGVPWAARVSANHRILAHETSSLPATARTPRDALRSERIRLLSTGPGLVDRGGLPRFILARDPARDSIVEYVGAAIASTDDPWASPLAPSVRALGLFVPGNDSDLRQFEGKAHTISELVQTSEPGTTGMVAWQGGRFPRGPLGLSSRIAARLADRFGRFANAIPRDPDVRYVALGFSFGGAVVGTALAHGLRVDAVGHLASAGLGAGVRRVADLPATARVPHYAFLAPSDTSVAPLLGLDLPRGPRGIGHGGDPLTDPDVRRLETGFQRAVASDDPADVARARDAGILRGHASILEHWGTDAKRGMRGVLTADRALAAAPRTRWESLAERLALPWSPLRRADYRPEFIDLD